jgi:hypothetical protein
MRPSTLGFGALFFVILASDASAQEPALPRCLTLDIAKWEWRATPIDPEPPYEAGLGPERYLPESIRIVDAEGRGPRGRPKPGTFLVENAAGADNVGVRHATLSDDSLTATFSNGWDGVRITLRHWPADSLSGNLRTFSDGLGSGRWYGEIVATTIPCSAAGVL